MRAVYVEKDLPIKALWPNVVFSRWSPSGYADVPEPPLPRSRWVRVTRAPRRRDHAVSRMAVRFWLERAETEVAEELR